MKHFFCRFQTGCEQQGALLHRPDRFYSYNYMCVFHVFPFLQFVEKVLRKKKSALIFS